MKISTAKEEKQKTKKETKIYKKKIEEKALNLQRKQTKKMKAILILKVILSMVILIVIIRDGNILTGKKNNKRNKRNTDTSPRKKMKKM